MAVKKTRKKPKKRGRKTIYSNSMVELICELIATSDKGLHYWCKKRKDLPGFSTIMTWLRDDNKKDFRDKYAHAREAQGDFFAYKSVEIASTPLIGKVIKETKDGTFTEISDNVSRSRLMYDANKFMAAKCNAKKYGDKLDVTTAGKKLPSTDVTALVAAFMQPTNEGNTEAADSPS